MRSADETRASVERGRAFARAQQTNPRHRNGASWFDAPLRGRLLRRVACRLPLPVLALARSERGARIARDAAFWAGVRSQLTRPEWSRLTRACFVALVYHRLAGDEKPGQEKLDIAPERFAMHLRLLRVLRFHILSAREVLAVVAAHSPPPRRGIVVTIDDAMHDCVAPLQRASAASPILFVPTRELSGSAHWLDGEPTMSWDDVRSLSARGVTIGAHARHHVRLTSVDRERLRDELAGSLADLRAQVPTAEPLLAYPNGAHDDHVCAETRSAGFEAAFTTEKGKNGVGTDRFRLRRVSVHGHDGALALLWKATTGEAVPPFVGRLRRLGRRPRVDGQAAANTTS